MSTTEAEDRDPAMLPLPGAPSSSWARFHHRVKTLFSGADVRVCVSFWLCGECYNAPRVRAVG